jgi:hypothetical protein
MGLLGILQKIPGSAPQNLAHICLRPSLQVLDITWAPLRQADYAISIAWLAAAAAALAAANTLLGS